MNYILDIHTHTISSGHAYSTVMDYVQEGMKKKLEAIGFSDHGPAMPGAADVFHIANQVVMPDYIEGIRILKGVEANIIDAKGTIDISLDFLKRLDYVIASFHDICLTPGSEVENTKTMIATMKNQPLVDIIGHPGNPKVPINMKEFVLAAGEYNKIIEINNSSFTNSSRMGSKERCQQIAHYAKAFGVKVIAGSDAHFHTALGVLDTSIQTIENAGIETEKIMNLSLEKLLADLANRRKV